MSSNTRPLCLAVASALCAPVVALAQDVSPNWFRSPAISPDGATLLFSHGGDIYSVPVAGGRAIPLTIVESYETRPVWSHDGKHIAFASNRNGNFDVYIMPADGGQAMRLTYHDADDFPSDFTVGDDAVIFESARVDDVNSVVFPSGVLAELYSVAVTGGTPDMLVTTPVINAQFDADGSRILYEDRKGYEDELRKHHTSSIARDLWLYDVATGEHTQLTTHAAEDRNPHWSPSEDAVYFLSERSGDFNVFRMPLRADADATQLTTFEHHPVRDLSVSPGGVMAFSWHGDLYRMTDGGQPELIDITIAVDSAGDEPSGESESSGATDFAVAPNGKEIAFVVRGDVFVTSVDFATTKRITNTPEQERSVDFAPDGRSIVYAGERDGSWNIYEASLTDDDELYFFSATAIDEKEVVATEAEEFQPAYSPDGEKIAYVYNRSALNVVDRESGETVNVLPGTAYYSYSDGDFWYDWSPDSAWLAVQFYDRDRVFVTEVGVVPADGSDTTPINLSNTGYNAGNPIWAMEGGAILWGSDRYGERSHGSWGGEFDVMGAFLTQDAFDRFTLSKEEYELRKELKEKKDKDDDEAGDDDKDADTDDADDDNEGDDDEAEEEEAPKVEFELDDLESRIVRLTINSSDLGDYAMTPEGDKLFYLARFEKGYDLWVHDFREESTKLLAKLGANGASMELSEDGKTIFMLANGSLSKIDASSGEKKPIAFRAELDIDADAERQYLFDHVWRQVKEKFYRPDLHGVDWAFYYDAYQPKLANLTNNRDFAIVLSEILGELNASHTGGRYFSDGGDGDANTAALGVFYDNAYEGPGMRIAEIMEGGPLDRAELNVEAGMVITHIDGVEITDDVNYYDLLDGKTGDRVRLTLLDDGETIEEVVMPISGGAQNQLQYERWVKTRRQLVDELSGGRLAYMHVRGMNDGSFRAFYSEVLGRHADKEGLIVDTRFNGGGWLHDDLVTFLTGVNYVNLYPRDDESPDTWYFGEPARRWVKPSVVVMSESNYSDAHFFPWAYTELKIGPTVGMPVPGTATAVWWERLHTGDLVFGIPQVGTKGAAGTYLENDQLEPTYKVKLDPVSAAKGTDTQIVEAVRVLLEEIDND
jgi:Tol biopolymer transport system component